MGSGVFKQGDQSWTSSYYVGIGTLLLAVCGLRKQRSPKVWFLAASSLVAFVLALGDKTVVYGWLETIVPPFRLMTFPVKFMIVVPFTAPLVAAFGLAQIRQFQAPAAGSGTLKPAIALGGLLLTIVGWQWVDPLPGDDVTSAITSGATRGVFLTATWITLKQLARGGTPSAGWHLDCHSWR